MRPRRAPRRCAELSRYCPRDAAGGPRRASDRDAGRAEPRVEGCSSRAGELNRGNAEDGTGVPEIGAPAHLSMIGRPPRLRQARRAGESVPGHIARGAAFDTVELRSGRFGDGHRPARPRAHGIGGVARTVTILRHPSWGRARTDLRQRTRCTSARSPPPCEARRRRCAGDGQAFAANSIENSSPSKVTI